MFWKKKKKEEINFEGPVKLKPLKYHPKILLGWAGVPAVPNSVFFLALLGFANALVWPAIWPLALQGLGKYTSTGSALLIMGIVGGAILPPLYGKISEIINDKQLAYLMMIPAYLYILYYAVAGHKVGREKV